MIANYRYVGNSQQKATTPGDTRSLCWEIGQRQKPGNASKGPDGLDPLPDTFRNLPSAAVGLAWAMGQELKHVRKGRMLTY
jgi:hypothetical protein